MPVSALLPRLLGRGDVIELARGRLAISAASGRPVPAEWMNANRLDLCRELLAATGQDAYEYLSYQTGCYGPHKSGGVTLQFVSILTGESAYVIFNADLTRQRSVGSKLAGSPLPKGQFRIGKRSHFYRFWLSTGLPLPKRLSSFHDYMGKLRGVVFEADAQRERIDASTIRPICLSVADVMQVFSPDSIQTILGQLPDYIQTRRPDKKSHQSETGSAFQRFQTAGKENHGNKVIRDCGDTYPLPQPLKHPKEQTVDEWLSDFEGVTA
jgi:hypothetical protein